MKKFIFIIFIFITCQANNKKYVIGTNRGWGFFASFFAALDHLAFCEQNNKTPVICWLNDCVYFDGTNNAWNNYFLPVSGLNYSRGDYIYRQYFKTHPCREIPALFFKGMRLSGPFEERTRINKFIDKYIKIRPRIKNKINEFYRQNIKGIKTIGIHLRGTDKSKEFLYPSAQTLLKKANEFKDCQYFIATDEQRLLDLAKKTLNGNVIYYDSIRSSDGKPVHYNNYNSYKVGEDI